MADEGMFIAKQDFRHGGVVVVYSLSSITDNGTIGGMKCSMYVPAEWAACRRRERKPKGLAPRDWLCQKLYSGAG